VNSQRLGDGDPWKSWRNAEVYDRFVIEGSIYRAINEELARRADLPSARRVLDLACGTGATAAACLARMSGDATLLGVDSAEPMVALARDNNADPRARFEVAAADALSPDVHGTFDRVVCCAAFWQFASPRAALQSIARVLDRGTLVFNVPAEHVAGEEALSHPLQVSLARAIEAHTGQAFDSARTKLDPDVVDALLDEAGFEPTRRHVFEYEGEQGEMLDLLGIPAMREFLAPDLGGDEWEAVLRTARGTTVEAERMRLPWIVFVARRRTR
jgi:ubiquinone/menaquinone biosynthesis C-methylase UbiE